MLSLRESKGRGVFDGFRYAKAKGFCYAKAPLDDLLSRSERYQTPPLCFRVAKASESYQTPPFCFCVAKAAMERFPPYITLESNVLRQIPTASVRRDYFQSYTISTSRWRSMNDGFLLQHFNAILVTRGFRPACRPIVVVARRDKRGGKEVYDWYVRFSMLGSTIGEKILWRLAPRDARSLYDGFCREADPNHMSSLLTIFVPEMEELPLPCVLERVEDVGRLAERLLCSSIGSCCDSQSGLGVYAAGRKTLAKIRNDLEGGATPQPTHTFACAPTVRTSGRRTRAQHTLWLGRSPSRQVSLDLAVGQVSLTSLPCDVIGTIVELVLKKAINVTAEGRRAWASLRSVDRAFLYASDATCVDWVDATKRLVCRVCTTTSVEPIYALRDHLSRTGVTAFRAAEELMHCGHRSKLSKLESFMRLLGGIDAGTLPPGDRRMQIVHGATWPAAKSSETWPAATSGWAGRSPAPATQAAQAPMTMTTRSARAKSVRITLTMKVSSEQARALAASGFGWEDAGRP